MRSLLLFLIFLAPGARAEPSSIVVHELHSPRQSGPTKVRVLAPDHADGPYRVLYVLPVEAGRGERWGDGLEHVRQLDLHNRFNLLCVAPEFSELPWFADHPERADLAQERYFLDDVLPLIESSYSVEPGREGRLLLGFSKSGWGAWSLLLRHPALFDKAAAWDAPLDQRKPDRFGMGPIFGTQANFEKYSIRRLLRGRRSELQGKPRLILTGYGSFREHHKAARLLLDSLHIPHVYRDGPQRAHHWEGGWVEEAVTLLAAPSPK